MIGYGEATRLLAAIAKPLGTEEVALDRADGRVLAAPVIAGRDAPAFAVSAMDGYAVRDADVSTLPVDLPVAAKWFAGSGVPNALEPSTCVRVFTGAPVPPGTDRVVVQEDVIAGDGFARLHLPLGRACHIRAAGSDFVKGDVLLPSGVPLNPQRLVAAAAADKTSVRVIRQPRVFILANGDELKPPGSVSEAPHRIPDSLSIALAALIRRWNGRVTGRQICVDDLDVLQQAASQAIADADVVVVTGGASVGEKDFAKAMFAAHDLQIVFSKVAIRPGKPVWLGTVGNTTVLGLPGNPTSALVTARLFLAPLLTGLAGLDPAIALAWHTKPCGTALDTNGDRHTFLRATAKGPEVEPLSNQDSGAQKILAAADCLISRPPGAGRVEPGASVEVLCL